jgi:iron complex transport system substrate-binding protein
VIRARAAVAAVALALLVAVTGCGSGGSSDSTGGDGDVAGGTAASESGAFPVTIAHKYGSTTIESAPKRIVVVGLKEQDDLLALGIVPVATTKWLDDTKGLIYPWATKLLGDAPPPEVLTQDDGVQVEKVAALAPDLIIGLYSGMTKAEYGKLSQLAPTVAQPGDVPDYGISWQDETTTVGEAVGKPAAAAKLVAEVDASTAKIVAENPKLKGRTALFATPYEGFYVYGSTDPRTRFLTDLGMTLPAEIDKVIGTKSFGASISAERADFLDVDAIVWLADAGKERDAVVGNKTYSALAVHREGRDVFVGNTGTYGQAISFVTVLSVPYTLARLAHQLTAAVDGDPATKIPSSDG